VQLQVQVQVQHSEQRAAMGASRRSVKTAQAGGETLVAMLAAQQQLLRTRPSVSERLGCSSRSGSGSGSGSDSGSAVVVSSWRRVLARRAHCSAAKQPCAPNLALACSPETQSPVLTRSARSGAVKLP
jgi:hypothetical protein